MTTSAPIACVLVPALPIAAHHGVRVLAERPLAIHQGRGSAARVVGCNVLAQQRGILVGQTLATARARVSDLLSCPLDPRRLAKARRWVLGTLLRASPRASEAGDDRFWAEPFDEERCWTAWGERTAQALDRLAPIRVGIGPDATVAHAAACSLPEGVRHIAPEEARAFLDASPLSVLELDDEAIELLASLGVRTVGQLRAMDATSLGARFGPQVAEARRRANGEDPRGPRTFSLSEGERAILELDEPLADREALVFLLTPALERLCKRVRNRDRGITALRLRLRCGRRELRCLARCGEPSTDPRTLLALLRARLESLALPGPIRGAILEVDDAVPYARQTEPMPHGLPPNRSDAREVALARLRARLGSKAVRRASRSEHGHPLERARWIGERLDGSPLSPVPGEALPWRHLQPPVRVVEGCANLAGRRRRILRLSRVERALRPWWRGEAVTELLAWAELEGPLLALLLGRFSSSRQDEWEVVAWLD